jgi:hypothetical protein
MTKTLLRAGALSCALLASTALTAPAAAQSGPLPRFNQVDANGVDLFTGDFFFSLVEGTIGSGEGALSMQLGRRRRLDRQLERRPLPPPRSAASCTSSSSSAPIRPPRLLSGYDHSALIWESRRASPALSFPAASRGALPREPGNSGDKRLAKRGTITVTAPFPDPACATIVSALIVRSLELGSCTG